MNVSPWLKLELTSNFFIFFSFPHDLCKRAVNIFVGDWVQYLVFLETLLHSFMLSISVPKPTNSSIILSLLGTDSLIRNR